MNLRNLFIVLAAISLLADSCSSSRSRSDRKIRDAVNDIWIIDTHEHFPPESERLAGDIDFFSLVIGYLQADMISSGMSSGQLDSMLSKTVSFEKRWKLFSDYWKNAKYTGYGRCLSITVEGLFGIKELTEESGRLIDLKMKETNREEGWYRHILKGLCRIDCSIVDPLGTNSRPEIIYPCDLFVKVKRFDNFTVINPGNISSVGKQYGIEIRKLRDYISVLDSAFRQAVKIERIVGIKSGLAYGRKLFYDDVPEDEAELLFERIMDNSGSYSAEDAGRLSDFMFHQIASKAGKYDLPFQIHTGILSRNFRKNPIENTNAIHLSNLFFKHRDTKFVIFHGSFPYMNELTYLAKHYPNVYIDMSWMYIISPYSSKIFLKEWLQTVPLNKILAFGGDASVEWAYGHTRMARETVTEVLSEMVNDGRITVDDAVRIADRIFRENAVELFNLVKEGDCWKRNI